MPQGNPTEDFAEKAGSTTGNPDELPRYTNHELGKGPYISNGNVLYAFRDPIEMMRDHGPLVTRVKKHGVSFLEDFVTGLMVGILTGEGIKYLNTRLKQSQSGNIDFLDELGIMPYKTIKSNSYFHPINEAISSDLSGEQPPLITKSPYVVMSNELESQRYGVLVMGPKKSLVSKKERTIKTDLNGKKNSLEVLDSRGILEQTFLKDAADAFRKAQGDTSGIATLEITFDEVKFPMVLMRYDGGIPVLSKFVRGKVEEVYSGMSGSGEQISNLVTKVKFVEPVSNKVLPGIGGENAIEGNLSYEASNRKDSVDAQSFNPWTGLVEIVVDMGITYTNPRIVGTTEQIAAPDIIRYLPSSLDTRSFDNELLGGGMKGPTDKGSVATSHQNVGRTILTGVKFVNIKLQGVYVLERLSVFTLMLTNPE